MSRPRYVTLAQLKRKQACSEYRDLFQDLFGRNGKVKITESNVAALSGAFNVYWASDHLLTRTQHDVYTRRIQGAQRPAAIVDKLLQPVPESVDSSARHEIRLALRAGLGRAYERETLWPAFAYAYNSPRT